MLKTRQKANQPRLHKPPSFEKRPGQHPNSQITNAQQIHKTKSRGKTNVLRVLQIPKAAGKLNNPFAPDLSSRKRSTRPNPFARGIMSRFTPTTNLAYHPNLDAMIGAVIGRPSEDKSEGTDDCALQLEEGDLEEGEIQEPPLPDKPSPLANSVVPVYGKLIATTPQYRHPCVLGTHRYTYPARLDHHTVSYAADSELESIDVDMSDLSGSPCSLQTGASVLSEKLPNSMHAKRGGRALWEDEGFGNDSVSLPLNISMSKCYATNASLISSLTPPLERQTEGEQSMINQSSHQISIEPVVVPTKTSTPTALFSTTCGHPILRTDMDVETHPKRDIKFKKDISTKTRTNEGLKLPQTQAPIPAPIEDQDLLFDQLKRLPLHKDPDISEWMASYLLSDKIPLPTFLDAESEEEFREFLKEGAEYMYNMQDALANAATSAHRLGENLLAYLYMVKLEQVTQGRDEVLLMLKGGLKTRGSLKHTVGRPRESLRMGVARKQRALRPRKKVGFRL